MDIPIFTVVYNWKIKKAQKIIDRLISDGWTLTCKNRGFFSTTYSFSKII